MELTKQVESILFSSGRKMPIEELTKLCKTNSDEVNKALNQLKSKYDSEDSSLMLVEEAGSWKLTVREKYLPLVQRIVTETELPRTLIETLAVIAWKAPILQSKVIDIRTNKAYDHLKELEEAGYISREKHGRTKMIKLAKKFYDYFDLPPEKAMEKFQKFESVEKAIIEKEQEAKKLKEEVKKKREEIKKEETKEITDEEFEEELTVGEDIKRLFGDENADSEMPKVQKPDEVPGKE